MQSDGNEGHGAAVLGFAERLQFNTIRIEGTTADGSTVCGTGFLFEYAVEGGVVHALITNRHVVRDVVRGRLFFTVQREGGGPAIGSMFGVDIDDGFESLWTSHPDPTVDLCALHIAAAIRWAAADGVRLFYTLMDRNSVISEENLAYLDAVDDVLMIGYPIGLWDRHNNLPIARRGITATHPLYDFEGRQEFLIDAACFPGSSGSPVFLYKPGSTLRLKHEHLTRSGNVLALLGVLYAGPMHVVDGNFVQQEIPTSFNFKVDVPMNLGCVIKARRLLEFQTLFERT